MRHYVKRLFSSAIMKSVTLALAFLLQLVLARLMGAEWYGEITYVLVWFSFLCVIAVAGTDSASVRFVAQYDSCKQSPNIQKFLAWAELHMNRSTKIVLPAGVVLGLILYLFNENISLLAFLIILIGIYFQSRNAFYSSVVQGYGRAALSQLPQGALLPVVLMIGLSVLWFLDIEVRSEYVAIIYVLSLFVVFLWVRRLVKKLSERRQEDDRCEEDSTVWKEVANHLFYMSLIGILLSRFDILLLGWFVQAEEVGIYNVSARLAELASLGLVVSNLVVAPMIARHYHNREKRELQSLLTFSGRIVAVATFAILILLYSVGEYVLGWYGEPFRDGYNVLMILAVGQFLNALFGPVGYILLMTGHSNVALRIYLIAVSIMGLLLILLIPIYGMIGAAVSSAIGVVIWNVMMCFYVVRRMGLDPTVVGLFKRVA